MTVEVQTVHSAQKAAIDAHQAGKLEKAAYLYCRAIAFSDVADANIYANYGALLRQQEQVEKASAIYRRGLAEFPDNQALLKNYGNLLLQEGKADLALAQYVKAENALTNFNKLKKIQRMQAQALAELGYSRLALQLLKPILRNDPDDQTLRLAMSELCLEINNVSEAKQIAGPLFKDYKPTLKQAFSFSNILLRLGAFNEALNKFEEATESHRRQAEKLDRKTRLSFDMTCWNFSLMLLRRGLLKRGWELFEHGRRVPNGRGAFQRTVFKAFSNSKIPEWNGSSLSGKRLLINGEQGIGDVMMFTMLVPPLIKEAKKIGIITYDRLTPIYRRSFPECTIYDTKNLKRDKINYQDWDLQIPIGSLPMLRYQNIDKYSDLKPFLKTDQNIRNKLMSKYKSSNNKLIGFSWKGGGNAKQKRTKSLQLEEMLPLFKTPGIDWISLQYGNVKAEIEEFNEKYNLNLIVPEDIDPLKDMDRWCALVDCCDQIISAANTTIHGAGCQGIPTTVILSANPDWRWLGDPGTPCYWYPSVKVIQQAAIGNWFDAVDQITKDLENSNRRQAKLG